jgi:hypothetical protein
VLKSDPSTLGLDSSRPEQWHLLSLIIQAIDLKNKQQEEREEKLLVRPVRLGEPEDKDYAELIPHCLRTSIQLGLSAGCPMWESVVNLSLFERDTPEKSVDLKKKRTKSPLKKVVAVDVPARKKSVATKTKGKQLVYIAVYIFRTFRQLRPAKVRCHQHQGPQGQGQ